MVGCRGEAVSRSRGEAGWRSRGVCGRAGIPKNRKQLRRLCSGTSKTPALAGVKINTFSSSLPQWTQVPQHSSNLRTFAHADPSAWVKPFLSCHRVNAPRHPSEEREGLETIWVVSLSRPVLPNTGTHCLSAGMLSVK